MVLEVQHLTKSFGPKSVLRDVSLTAETGTCVGVVGRNGAGKSTLFNLLTNVLLPDSGQLVLDGAALGETFLVAVKRRMGALVNQTYLVEQLTPEEYLQFVASIYELPNAQPHIESLLAHLLEEYPTVRHKRLGSFSTGTKQKVAIASCLLQLYARLVVPVVVLDCALSVVVLVALFPALRLPQLWLLPLSVLPLLGLGL